MIALKCLYFFTLTSDDLNMDVDSKMKYESTDSQMPSRLMIATILVDLEVQNLELFCSHTSNFPD
jgi:hypothetical protein